MAVNDSVEQATPDKQKPDTNGRGQHDTMASFPQIPPSVLTAAIETTSHSSHPIPHYAVR